MPSSPKRPPPVPITQPESDLVRLPVAQMVTLALLALLDETRSESITKALERTLPRWPEALSRAANNDSVPDEPLGRSPPDGDDNDNDERGSNRNSGMPPPPPPPPPSSTPRHPASSSAGTGGAGSGSQRYTSNPAYLPAPEYCTQACLLGLRRGGPLDLACPNVREHATAVQSKRGTYIRTAYHAISPSELCAMLLEQLTDNLGMGLECLARYGLWGSIGTLFKITLIGYGYTFVAKGVQDADEMTLKEEAALYMDDATQNLQGVLMPVYLGCIDLHERPYLLSTGAQIWHMMLLSWAGWSFERRMPSGLDEAAVDDIVDDMYWELCRHGIYHYDLRDTNLAWNNELGRVMALDFDRAVIMTQDEYNEKELPRVTGTYLGAPLEIKSKFQANRREKERLQAKLANSKAEPMAAIPVSPEAEKRKHRSGGEDTVEQKRTRRNGAALDLDEPAKT